MSSAGDTLASAPERVREQFTVLVVEDDDAMRDVLQAETRNRG